MVSLARFDRISALDRAHGTVTCEAGVTIGARRTVRPLVFRGPDRSLAERFAAEDPYVAHGSVERWHVREWSVVVGSE